MFGCIAAGRPVQTNLTALSPTQYTFLLSSTPLQPLNHLVVFLLPDTTLLPETAASVYIQLSPTQPFQFLGAIGNEKPSAIFRVKGLATPAPAGGGETDVDYMTDESSSGGLNTTSNDTVVDTTASTTVTLGISIEPLSSVLASLSTLPAQHGLQSPWDSRSTTPLPASSSQLVLGNTNYPPKPMQTLTLARRIIKNAFNYLGSFAVKAQIPGSVGVQDVVPLKAFQDWWMRFEKKVEFDPGMLERED